MLATLELNRGYRIGGHHPGVYLSYSELQVIIRLLQGKVIKQIALDLGISHRTVNFYCKNMMKLMGCDDLGDLIDCVRQSELDQYFD